MKYLAGFRALLGLLIPLLTVGSPIPSRTSKFGHQLATGNHFFEGRSLGLKSLRRKSAKHENSKIVGTSRSVESVL